MYARRVARIARAPSQHTQLTRPWVRCYADAAAAAATSHGHGDGQYLQQLRADMLGRDVIVSREILSSATSSKLTDTLEGFLPTAWCHRHQPSRPQLGAGYHLVYFNPSMPADRLLPDGTDPLHDPGAPWVRRMWAGGSLRFRPELYYQKNGGFVLNSSALCAERIQDVQLRGQGDSAKVFVTIERRFARYDVLAAKHKDAIGSRHFNGREGLQHVWSSFKAQQHDGEEWGDAMLKEVRNLVFLKERTAAELDAIQAGRMAPVRYLAAPTQPDFSHTLTPTRSMLFRFSALTWNAHRIHLDPHYARTVEGHRNVLVHGPLTLIIMLQAISSYIKEHTNAQQYLESIEYKNLAPLYCDEEMRVCGKVIKTSDNGNQYDVWIEGPTGGMAVKGTVNAVAKSSLTPLSRVTQDKMAQPDQGGKAGKRTSIHPAPQTTSDPSSSSGDGLKPIEPRLVLTPFDLPQVSTVDQNQSSPKPPDQSQQHPVLPRRVKAPPSPMVPTMSSHSLSILQRLASYAPEKSSSETTSEAFSINPITPIRTSQARPQEDTSASTRSTRVEIRKMYIPHIARVGHTMDIAREIKQTKFIQWKNGRRTKRVIDRRRRRKTDLEKRWERKMKRLLEGTRAQRRAAAAAKAASDGEYS